MFQSKTDADFSSELAKVCCMLRQKWETARPSIFSTQRKQILTLLTRYVMLSDSMRFLSVLYVVLLQYGKSALHMAVEQGLTAVLETLVGRFQGSLNTRSLVSRESLAGKVPYLCLCLFR